MSLFPFTSPSPSPSPSQSANSSKDVLVPYVSMSEPYAADPGSWDDRQNLVYFHGTLSAYNKVSLDHSNYLCRCLMRLRKAGSAAPVRYPCGM